MSVSVKYLSKEHLDKFWNQIEPLLEEGLLFCEDELNISQLRLLITQGAVHTIIGIDSENGNVKGALVFEIVNYPNYRVMNIISYGGYNLFADEYEMEQLKNILRGNGISKIQGWCKPAQARLFKSQFGFETPYQMVRLDIGG